MQRYTLRQKHKLSASLTSARKYDSSCPGESCKLLPTWVNGELSHASRSYNISNICKIKPLCKKKLQRSKQENQ